MSTKRIDPRVRRTRILLRDALITLLSEKEYEHITINDITELATVNRAIFYLHFLDKEDLVVQTIDEMLCQLFGDVHKKSSEIKSIDEFQKYIALHIFEHIAQYNAFFRVMLIKKGIPSFLYQMKKFMYTFYEDKFSNSKFDANTLPISKEVISSYIASAYVGVIEWWLENDMPYSPASMADQMIELNSKGAIYLINSHISKELF
ncbi:TetR family transcriptional regulator [Bacillus sp. AFS054943]|uniref:TetR family transcriptional regulator n=1 Tax=Bacillus cereus TaxID=1396 RepID=A0A2C1LP54_BACCE|nr:MULTISPECIES: TetR/AcrR family transcriptional regulator [Bacillus]PGL85674.1 TetR family transcriptional regulator [Bacillus sp. AFS054943]PGT99450.1 TetR family transcriptional regulator [Bacillus cereus]